MVARTSAGFTHRLCGRLESGFNFVRSTGFATTPKNASTVICIGYYLKRIYLSGGCRSWKASDPQLSLLLQSDTQARSQCLMGRRIKHATVVSSPASRFICKYREICDKALSQFTRSLCVISCFLWRGLGVFMAFSPWFKYCFMPISGIGQENQYNTKEGKEFHM